MKAFLQADLYMRAALHIARRQGELRGAACSHPHAYLTSDNRHVVYTTDPYWIGQVFLARIPDAFWRSLD